MLEPDGVLELDLIFAKSDCLWMVNFVVYFLKKNPFDEEMSD